MGNYKQLTKNTFIFAVGSFSVKAIQFFLMPLITLSMTTEDYGTAESITSLAELIIPLLTLGLQDAVFRFTMRQDVNKKSVLTNTMGILVSGFILVGISVVVAAFFVDFQICLLFAALYICVALSNVWGQFVRGIGKVSTFAISGVIQALILAVSNAVFVYWLKMGAIGYLLSLVLAYLSSLFILFFAGEVYKNIRVKSLDKNLFKWMIKYSLPLMPNNLCWWFIQVVNRYIIIYFCGSGDSGLYVATSKIATLINIFGTIFLQAWTISTVKSMQDKDKAEFNSIIFRYYGAFLHVAASFLLLLLPFVSKFLLQGEFADSWRYSSIAIFTAIISCYCSFFGAYYGAAMKTKMVFVSTLAGALSNSIACPVLVYFMGIKGALFASLLGYMIMTIIRIVDTQKFSKLKANWVKEVLLLMLICGQAVFILESDKISSNLIYYGVQGVIIFMVLLVHAKDIVLLCKQILSILKNIKHERGENEEMGNNNSESIKQTLLDMAKVFHEFCCENGIKYYMIEGTLLGAVRHKGFIPWDDDIDFGVPREDYEKMLKLRDKLPERYTFNVPADGGHYKYGFCKMYDESTTFIESGQETKFIGGVFIDIFPLDNIGDNYNVAVKLAKKIHIRKRIVSGIYQKGDRSTFVKSIATRFLQLIPENPKLFEMPYDVIKKYRNKPSKYVINVYGAYKEKEIAEVRVLGTPKLYDFEDTQLYGVEYADEYLTRIYGDYMTPPPEDKRGGHSICYIDLNVPYKEYIKNQVSNTKN